MQNISGKGRDLPPGDLLALERTRLASRSTLLAYLRTALAFLTAGGGMAEFLRGDLYRLLSGALMAAAPALILLGFWNFYRTESKVAFLPAVAIVTCPAADRGRRKK